MDKFLELHKKRLVGATMVSSFSKTNLEYVIKDVSYRIFSSGDKSFVLHCKVIDRGNVLVADHEILVEDIATFDRTTVWKITKKPNETGDEKQYPHLSPREYFEVVMGWRKP